MNALFGPVQSWGLGRTLGVDLVASDRKYCSFDCVYCPGGGHTHCVTGRRWFLGMSALQALLESDAGRAGHVPSTDYIAFTGRGEPTLASNLGQAIDLARSLLGLPVAVLTNSSLMPRDDVKTDLAKADVVIAKLDAASERLFHIINRPFVQYTLAEILDGLRDFRCYFRGKLVIQTTVVDANKASVDEIAAIAHDLSPDELQVNLRLSDGNGHAMATEVEQICSSFSDLDVTSPHAIGPLWEPVIDAVEPQRSGRHNAEVMLVTAEEARLRTVCAQRSGGNGNGGGLPPRLWESLWRAPAS